GRRAHEVHGDFHVTPLVLLGGVMHVHAGHTARDAQRARPIGGVGSRTVVGVEPGVVRVDAGKAAGGAIVPRRQPCLAAGERRVELLDTEPVEWIVGDSAAAPTRPGHGPSEGYASGAARAAVGAPRGVRATAAGRAGSVRATFAYLAAGRRVASHAQSTTCDAAETWLSALH